MGPYVWCAIGAALGWLGSMMGPPGGLTLRIESVAVGVFGAFLGGEFLAAMVLPDKHGIDMATVSMAVGGAVVSLLLLGLMRRAVGPMKPGKARQRHS
jgi:uncharacterized membrane protein YeaQ/YmgE (transglycosylase-associated protein family)